MLLIAALQFIQDGRTAWQDNYLLESANTDIKYFKVDTGRTSDIDVVVDLIHELPCSDNKSVNLLEITMINNLNQDEVVLYWNTTAILLKVSTVILLS